MSWRQARELAWEEHDDGVDAAEPTTRLASRVWLGAPGQFMVDDEPWMADGACVGCDPDLFFPHNGDLATLIPDVAARTPDEVTAMVAEAQAICARCPVIVECDAYATGRNERFGVWGGVWREEAHEGSHPRYNRGCRCERCTEAHADYVRDLRAARKAG